MVYVASLELSLDAPCSMQHHFSFMGFGQIIYFSKLWFCYLWKSNDILWVELFGESGRQGWELPVSGKRSCHRVMEWTVWEQPHWGFFCLFCSHLLPLKEPLVYSRLMHEKACFLVEWLIYMSVPYGTIAPLGYRPPAGQACSSHPGNSCSGSDWVNQSENGFIRLVLHKRGIRLSRQKLVTPDKWCVQIVARGRGKMNAFCEWKAEMWLLAF